MGLFDWFKRLLAPLAATPALEPEPIIVPQALPPEPVLEKQWRIGLDGDTLWMLDPEGTAKSVPFSGLAAVAIEAVEGADGIDQWWLFYGPEEDVAFIVPLGARGEAEIVERLAVLPGFRHDVYAQAVRTDDLDTFVVWSRPFD